MLIICPLSPLSHPSAFQQLPLQRLAFSMPNQGQTRLHLPQQHSHHHYLLHLLRCHLELLPKKKKSKQQAQYTVKVPKNDDDYNDSDYF